MDDAARRYPLSQKMPAGQALLLILRRLFETMEANEAGLREGLDPESLHDFRVAVRRTRCAFGQVENVLPAPVLVSFRPRFAWLGQVTGATRDMDVYLLRFCAYRDSLPETARDDLEPLHHFLLRQQKRERRKMLRSLDTRRYGDLLRDWKAFLETGPDPAASPPGSALPVRETADARIIKAFRRVMRKGKAIDIDSPASALHELRIACKKLRYLVEFFQSLYPPGRIRKAIRDLKILQDSLGSFQDLQVQTDSLRRFAAQMADEGPVPAKTLLAMGMLIGDLHRHQGRTREEFGERFDKFSRKPNRRIWTQTFRSTGEKNGG